MKESLAAFESFLAQLGERHAARHRIARRMQAAGFGEQARAVVREALAAKPDCPEVRVLAQAILGRGGTQLALFTEAAIRSQCSLSKPLCNVSCGQAVGCWTLGPAPAVRHNGCARRRRRGSNLRDEPRRAAAATEIVARNGFATVCASSPSIQTIWSLARI